MQRPVLSKATCFLLLLFCLSVGGVHAAERSAIASAHPLATEAGFETLAAGGNAFDAAIAVTAALAVVEPTGSGLGGGGFWLLHRAADGYEVMVDGRERAPLAARRDMFLDAQGKPVPGASLNGPLAAAIPGVPAALEHLAKRYGRLPLAQSLAPALRYAAQGFPVYEHYRYLAKFRIQALTDFGSAGVFLVKGQVPPVGYMLRQPELAETLRSIAQDGRAGFYQGPVARRMVDAVRKAGGIWTLKDLASYSVKERQPVHLRYHDVDITTVALPSSGGIVMSEALNILEGLPLQKVSALERKRYIIEAMRRAYHDRARYLGDADYVPVDTSKLTSKAYAAERRKSIGPRATPNQLLSSHPVPTRPKGTDTSHFSIIDAEGNRVAATLSINYPFGSGFMPEGTGVVLNNEMDDFSIKPGVGNVYGLVGNEANAIAPGKRPLSSMTPSFFRRGKQVVVAGTPGGSRIISMVLLAALEYAERRGGPAEWVALPRYHHQYLPDVVEYEAEAFDDFERQDMGRLGYKMKPVASGYGNMQIVMKDSASGEMSAASDPRGEGLAAVR